MSTLTESGASPAPLVQADQEMLTMRIQFDVDAANALISACDATGDRLRAQAGQRRLAVEEAIEDFSGGYQRLFAEACSAEAMDRGRLAGVLYDLADQVREARQKAGEERHRRERLAAWQEREEARRRERAVALASGDAGTLLTIDDAYDPRPSEFQIYPPTVSAGFVPSARDRMLRMSITGGTISASPERLRAFARRSRAMNDVLRSELTRVNSAWLRFTANCSWVPLGTASFVTGFRRYLLENQTDESWMTSLADAFEQAGSGRLSTFAVTLALSRNQLEQLQELRELLLGGTLTPEQVAQVWGTLAGSSRFDAERFIRQYSFELASLNGLPFSVMDQAGRYALDYALDPKHPGHLLEAYTRMGFTAGERSPENFRADLVAIRAALREARKLTIDDDDTVQLVSIGRHDGAVTAGISMGNLDTAPTVGIFVSGMMSNVRGLDDTFDAFFKIRNGDTSIAMLTWTGYRSPTMLEETVQARADAGAKQLTAFLDGFAAQPSRNRRQAPRRDTQRLVIMGHSYGTNVIAEALKTTEASAAAFVTIGSAGLKQGTTAQDLRVPEIYATHAAGDGIATGIGQHLEFELNRNSAGFHEARVDPRELEGAQVFSSEETRDGKAVTMHNLLNPVDLPDWLQDLDGITAADEIGYMNEESSSVRGLRKIMIGAQP